MAVIRKQVTKAGKMLEVKYFPTHKKSGIKIPEEPKCTKSKEKMREENRRKSIRKFILLVNTNFDEEDYYASLDYMPEFAPLTIEQAQRDFDNYIERVKYHRRKKGLGNDNFRYAYSCHCKTYKRGIHAGKNNYHFHLFISSDGMTAKEYKDLWKFGMRGNITNYDPYRFGPETAANYLTKTAVGKKMYKCSRNMKKPKIKDKKDGQISERKLRELGEHRIDDRQYWERRYPSYNFVRCESQYNEYNGHWYITVIMYKKLDKHTYYQKSRTRATQRALNKR